MAGAGAAALTQPLARGDRAGAALISSSERLLAGHLDSSNPVQARCAVDVSPASSTCGAGAACDREQTARASRRPSDHWS